MDNEAKIQQLESRVKELEDILFGLSDDPRFKAVVRQNIIIGEHASNKPTIINRNGKKYNLQTV